MAQRKEDTGRRTKRARKAKRHPLLVYHNLGRRYRPMAVLFVLVGVILLLPSLFDSLDSDVIAADLLGISVRTLRNKLNEYREAGVI